MKRTFVKAASVDSMLNAFERRINDLEGNQDIKGSIDLNDDLYGAGLMFDLDEDKVDEKRIELEITAKYNDRIRDAIEKYDAKWDDGLNHLDASFVLFVGYGLVPHVDFDAIPPYTVCLTYDDPKPSDDVVRDLAIPGSVETSDGVSGCSDVNIEGATGTTADMLVQFEDKLDELEDVDSSTEIAASEFVPLEVTEEDYRTQYLDTDGVFTGSMDPNGERVSLGEIKEYWNNSYNDDPSLQEGYEPDEGEQWVQETISWLKPVTDVYESIDVECDEDLDLGMEDEGVVDEGLEAIEGKDHYDESDVYMLMEYVPGSPEDGIEADSFFPYGKFFAESEEEADKELEDIKKNDKRGKYIANAYIIPYNSYFDNGEEVFSSLKTLVNYSIRDPEEVENDPYLDDIPFASTDINAASTGDEDDYVADTDVEDDFGDDDFDDDYDPEFDSEEGDWEQIDQKSVRDEDGFLTEYTLYHNTVTGLYVCVFGDSEIYRPEDGYFDFETENYDEAIDWFNTYSLDDED